MENSRMMRIAVGSPNRSTPDGPTQVRETFRMENSRMMRIAVGSPTLDTLDHQSGPVVLCNDSGRELGMFIPDRDHVPHEEDGQPARREPEPWAHLGGSVGIYGYASDLE